MVLVFPRSQQKLGQAARDSLCPVGWGAGGQGCRAGFIFPKQVPIISLPFRSKPQAGKERLGEQKGGAVLRQKPPELDSRTGGEQKLTGKAKLHAWGWAERQQGDSGREAVQRTEGGQKLHSQERNRAPRSQRKGSLHSGKGQRQ